MGFLKILVKEKMRPNFIRLSNQADPGQEVPKLSGEKHEIVAAKTWKTKKEIRKQRIIAIFGKTR